ncbi:MAG: Rne/Rng family ribonuclease [Candidatus Azobacteroides sp.]|nr:Rne/Rng family ribonuclease [Candidatus Azobacteroides sp.]
MTNELVLDVKSQEVTIAILQDKRLMELQKETRNVSFGVRDIYLGKVKKIMPGLNAAFVDVGYEKDAFLHYLDLGHHFNTLNKYVQQTIGSKKKGVPISKLRFEKELNKDGLISEVLQPGQEILVQITKEPISTKGPRLTSEISLAGRNLVLIPFGDKVSVSQKIKSSEERIRLKQLMQSIKPKNFGIIIRTLSEGKRVAELDTELKILLKRWEEVTAKLQKSPSLILEETGRTVALLRDVFNPSFKNIYMNDKDVFHEVKDYVTLISPEQAGTVKLYEKEEPIFDHFDVTKQIKSSFGKTVSFKRGAYLIIEHTEAMHVIDVNSGNRNKGNLQQEENALEVNMSAATEIARQLRLRDMGGIIVIDFIDMQESEHRQRLLEHMLSEMSEDRAKHSILPLSKFGLMQITRQRVRPVLDIITTEDCPTCFGKGSISPSILFTDKLQDKIDYMTNTLGIKKFKLYVHPFVEAYIKKGFVSLLWKWKLKYGFGFKIISDQNLALLEYHFYNEDKEEIDLKQEIEIK